MAKIRYEFDQIAPVYKENEAFMLMRNLKDSFYAHQSKPSPVILILRIKKCAEHDHIQASSAHPSVRDGMVQI